MILNLITRDTVKTELGIIDSSLDADIDAMIPIVSNDVRNILNNRFDTYTGASFQSGSNEIYLVDGCPVLGQVVYHPNLPLETYLQSYDPDTGKYTMSGTSTDQGSYVYPQLMIFQFAPVAKMIYYRIQERSVSKVEKEKLSSVTYGPVSKQFADGEINKQWNYPQTIIDELGPRYAKVGR